MTPRVTIEGDVILDLLVENSTRGQDVNVAGQNLPSFGTRKVATRLRLRDGESNLMAGLLREDDRATIKGIPRHHALADPQQARGVQRHRGPHHRHRDAADAAHRPDAGNHRRRSQPDLHRHAAEPRPEWAAAADCGAARAGAGRAGWRAHRGAGATRWPAPAPAGAATAPGVSIIPPGSSPIPGTTAVPAAPSPAVPGLAVPPGASTGGAPPPAPSAATPAAIPAAPSGATATNPAPTIASAGAQIIVTRRVPNSASAAAHTRLPSPRPTRHGCRGCR
jgi:general secretion pathway protein D